MPKNGTLDFPPLEIFHLLYHRTLCGYLRAFLKTRRFLKVLLWHLQVVWQACCQSVLLEIFYNQCKPHWMKKKFFKLCQSFSSKPYTTTLNAIKTMLTLDQLVGHKAWISKPHSGINLCCSAHSVNFEDQYQYHIWYIIDYRYMYSVYIYKIVI